VNAWKPGDPYGPKGRTPTQAHMEAWPVPCDVCGAEPGQDCTNTYGAHIGARSNWPHVARDRAARQLRDTGAGTR
jgi:hypothetical protein